MGQATEDSGTQQVSGANDGSLTHAILGSFFDVYNELGTGFLESVYRRAMAEVLTERGLCVEQERSVHVHFRGAIIGRFLADLVVERQVVVELKAVRSLLPEHQAQLINYLRASTFEIGLLLNFGRTPELKRLVYSNERKRPLRRTGQAVDLTSK